MHLISFAQFESNIYWTDWYNKSVYRSQRVPRMGYSYPFEVRDALSGALDIRAVSIQRQAKSWNQCAQENGGCSHLCFYRGIDYVCACPDRLDGVNGPKCSTVPKELVQARQESDQQPDYSDELTDENTSTENQDNNNNKYEDDLKNKEDNEREFFVLIALGVVIVMVVIIMLVMFSKATPIYIHTYLYIKFNISISLSFLLLQCSLLIQIAKNQSAIRAAPADLY